MTSSAICEGALFHVRRVPRPHRFRYRLFLMYVDLDELPTLFRGRWLWSARGPNLVWFRRRDYMGPLDRPLREAVLDRVEAQLQHRPTGAVRVLTHLRTFGYLFNPVTFYFCHDADGVLEAVVAEITNTPWRERHAYVLDARTGRSQHGRSVDLRWRFEKSFHVSPFLPMQQVYEWRLRLSDARIDVRMRNLEQGVEVFHAGLSCERRRITSASLARALVVHPLLTLRIHAAIYLQAMLLRIKRVPFHAHPKRLVAARGVPAPR